MVCGARVASPPRVTVEFELVRALAHELRRAGEGPSFGGRDEGHHDAGPTSSSAASAASAVIPLYGVYDHALSKMSYTHVGTVARASCTRVLCRTVASNRGRMGW